MKGKIWTIICILLIGILAACGNETKNEKNKASEEPKMLEVDFIVPEKANAGEKVELKAIVTYGDEKVKDADEMNFEYWEQGNKDNSKKIEAKNNGDGTYTAEVVFEQDGVYEMFAHTTARDFHSMPKKSITIGEGASAHHEEVNHEEEHQHEEGGHEHSGHAEGFDMQFMEPKDVKAGQKINLTVHLLMDHHPLEKAKVRYEIVADGSDKHEWVETEESAPGQYTGSHAFATAGKYTITIHVQNDQGLHEHEEHKVEVSK